MSYWFYLQHTPLPWPVLIAMDVGIATLSGIVAAGTLGEVRARLRPNFTAMLESSALLPWMAGAFVVGLSALTAGVTETRSPIIGLATALGAVGLWSWGFTAWWVRRERRSNLPSTR